jgi:hypothetical protein
MKHRTAPLLSISVLAVLCAPSLLRTLQEKEKEVPFAEFGKGFLKAHGNPAQASDLPIEKFREDWCVHAVLGGVDVAYPIAFLSDKQEVEDLKTVVVSLLEMQSKWIDLLAPDPAKVQGAHADITELENWVKSWKQPSLANVKPEEKGKDHDLFKVLAANEAQTKAAARLTDFVCKPDALGVAPKEQQPLHILLSPTRRDFVELVGYAGLLDETKQAELWKPAVSEFTTFWIGWDLVMALEYPPWAPDPAFHTSLPMNKFDKTGLEQHAVQQAANAWQWLCYADDGAPHFHQAIAMSLAISVCGEINALEGDGWGYGTTGAKTQPYERFVPGGNSSGGMLPPMPAAGGDAVKKGRWREGAGKDHFATCLRKGQKNGLKALPKSKPEHLDQAILDDKNAHFLIVAPDESAKYVVSAPFFGPDAKLKPYPPTTVILDYREFFRAYKCSFFNWVLTQGDPKDPAASAAKFRELMKKSAEGEGADAFDEIVKSIYGIPLSGKDGKTDSLEWRFLDWLGKGH